MKFTVRGLILFFVVLVGLVSSSRKRKDRSADQPVHVKEGKLVKGNRNAIYLVRDGEKHLVPDFYTFSKMGFNLTSIEKIPDEELLGIPEGDNLKPIPVFRPEDYMYHKQCEDHDRMVNDLGTVPNMGNFMRYMKVKQRIQKTKAIDILALGGSITAGGYFLEFVRLLQTEQSLNVTYHNHGHGATEITYTIFCVDIDKYSPDIVLIDFSVNDYGHPKLMEALIRKVVVMKSSPVVLLVNLWVKEDCPVTRYLLHAYYYQLPVINMCPSVDLCFGKKHMPSYISEQYSKTDGVHPWGPAGVKFIGDMMYAWWKRLDSVVSTDTFFDTSGKTVIEAHSFSNLDLSKGGNSNSTVEIIPGPWDGVTGLPPPIYVGNPIGLCTLCEALADDADARLSPMEKPRGFRMVTRVKIGYGGFDPALKSTATKSFKRCWQADKVGSSISFKFYGSSVKIAIWQRRDGMGVIHAFVDRDRSHVVKASGFFKGYTWAMEKNNTGRSEIMPLFEGLADKEHTLTLEVGNEPANIWVKGHTVQVFAILSASDNLGCKKALFVQ